ncbi:hypothetical protein GCM10007049_37480 [Echinicola pacifica]|uniref:Uncharacterized protein n=2 Tax=Echinicola pacifica TaxID=346377 RepID=A0A918QD75_9BACT|nr:hypothetical protein GCM10007049_37480 [Echinicola pacifica]
MYLVIISFIRKEREDRLIDFKTQNTKVVIPLKLQAGERLCLLLERISPNNLVRRLNDPTYTAGELHGLLLQEVRNEFNHNFSQQLYFSDETWESIRNAVEEVISLINSAMQDVSVDDKSVVLAKKVFQLSLGRKNDGISFALTKVKDEIRFYL